jgi:hypothetical protein
MPSSIGCAGAIVALANSDAYRHQVPRVPRRPRPSIAGTLLHAQAQERRLRRLSDERQGFGIPRLAACQVDAETRPDGTAAAEFTDIHYVTNRQIDARH